VGKLRWYLTGFASAVLQVSCFLRCQNFGTGGAAAEAAHGWHNLKDDTFVSWTVVRFTTRHGHVQEAVVPHLFVQDRWLGRSKASASVAFVPLYHGYAVNCQHFAMHQLA
jgi:ABC-type Co2+ transport system permease subunit